MLIRISYPCTVLTPTNMLPKHHGSVYVEVIGEEEELLAEAEASLLAPHKCHETHGKHCECPILDTRRVFWRNEKENRNKRTTTATVVGGEGEALTWYPIGTARSWQRY